MQEVHETVHWRPELIRGEARGVRRRKELVAAATRGRDEL